MAEEALEAVVAALAVVAVALAAAGVALAAAGVAEEVRVELAAQCGGRCSCHIVLVVHKYSTIKKIYAPTSRNDAWRPLPALIC